MGHDRIRQDNTTLRTGAVLLALLTFALNPTRSAADESVPASDWRYHDYLRYSAAPSSTAFSNVLIAGPQISLTDLLPHQARMPEAHRNLMLSASFDTRADWESIRYGLGVFANLPDEGQFHFNLYVRPNAQRPGLRWQLQPDGLPMTGNATRHLWSIGGFLDYGRGRAGLHSSIGFAPQLIVNLGPVLGLPGDAQASFQYAYWRSDTGADPFEARRAIQATLAWRF